MPKKLYKVLRGRKTGIFDTWSECEAQVKGYPGAIFKGFSTLAETEAYELEPGKRPAKRPRTSAEDKPSTISRKKPRLDGRSIIYTDGACTKNGRVGARAGVGVYFGPGDARNVSERLEGHQTNQRAELSAVLRAIEAADSGPVAIMTDSKYTMQCVDSWIDNWRKRGWKTTLGEDVKNRDLIERLDSARQKHGDVVFQHVRGHSSCAGNNAADELATQGARK